MLKLNLRFAIRTRYTITCCYIWSWDTSIRLTNSQWP